MKSAIKQSILTVLTMLSLLMSFAACSSDGQRDAGSSAHNTAGESSPFDTDIPEPEASAADADASQGLHGNLLPNSLSDTEPAQQASSTESAENLRIRLTFDNNTVSVHLYDTPAGRDLLSRLPLKLEFEDYVGTEKISYLSEPLMTGESPGTQPDRDFSYYAPWGNLAVFYNDLAPAANGLVVMGSIESGKEHLASMTEDFTMTIELDN